MMIASPPKKGAAGVVVRTKLTTKNSEKDDVIQTPSHMLQNGMELFVAAHDQIKAQIAELDTKIAKWEAYKIQMKEAAEQVRVILPLAAPTTLPLTFFYPYFSPCFSPSSGHAKDQAKRRRLNLHNTQGDAHENRKHIFLGYVSIETMI